MNINQKLWTGLMLWVTMFALFTPFRSLFDAMFYGHGLIPLIVMLGFLWWFGYSATSETTHSRPRTTQETNEITHLDEQLPQLEEDPDADHDINRGR